MFTSKADRERLTQMMFESFNVSGLYVAEQPVAALYAVGKVTGVSVDVGYSVTDVAPVVEGSLVSPAAQRCEAGHSLVTAELIARQPCTTRGCARSAGFAAAEGAPRARLF